MKLTVFLSALTMKAQAAGDLHSIAVKKSGWL